MPSSASLNREDSRWDQRILYDCSYNTTINTLPRMKLRHVSCQIRAVNFTSSCAKCWLFSSSFLTVEFSHCATWRNNYADGMTTLFDDVNICSILEGVESLSIFTSWHQTWMSCTHSLVVGECVLSTIYTAVSTWLRARERGYNHHYYCRLFFTIMQSALTSGWYDRLREKKTTTAIRGG